MKTTLSKRGKKNYKTFTKRTRGKGEEERKRRTENK